jgi:S-DNA-T family DNA segregation ATPase FtsK/SpoIIIE
LAQSALSRRVSEFAGVVLFAVALIWFIALVTHSNADPVWYFNNIESGHVDNFVGRFGAFISLVSIQIVGYTALVLPVIVAVIGWHYFWCKSIDAGYTKLVGAGLFVTSLSGLIALATTALHGPRSNAGGAIGSLTAWLLSRYLAPTGAAILLLTLLALAVILSTQFSFGRAAEAVAKRARMGPSLMDRWREWQQLRQREKQRKQIIEKHVKKAGKDRAPEIAGRAADAAEKLRAARARDVPSRPAAAACRGPAAEEPRGAPPGWLCDASRYAARRAQGSAEDR